MAISAISGFTPAISLIDALSPLARVSLLQPTTGVGNLLALNSTRTSISDVGRLLNGVETLQAAATALSTPDIFAAHTVSASNALTATATAGTATPTGSYALQVDQLAQAQTLTTAPLASSLTTIGGSTPSTLTFQFAGGGSRSVALRSTDNTLAGIASAINAADIGIEAQLQTSASGVRLALSGQTGAGNAFTIAVSGDASVVGLLAYPGGSGGPTLTTSAGDARGQIDGIAFSASTNSINTAVPGLSLNLLGTGLATLAVAAANTDVAKAVRGFVDAYNDVRRGFAAAAAATPSLGLSASLFGTQLSAALNSPVGTTAPPSLSLAQIGISGNFDGTLNFDARIFQAALEADSTAVAAVFSNGGNGVAERLAAQAAGPLSPERLLPLLSPALTLESMLSTSTDNLLLLSLFNQNSILGSASQSSSLSNELLFAQLLAGNGNQSTIASLTDVLLAETLFANQL